MFDGKPQQYPHLVRFLNHFSRRSIGYRPLPVAPFFVFMAMVWAILFGLILQHPFIALLAFPLGVAGIILSSRSKKRELTADEQFLMEGQDVARIMSQCIEKRRLHRDLDSASMTLMEESARHYWRVHENFNAPYWTSNQLPLQYQSIRQQALLASDKGMSEIMLMFRDYLPQQVNNRHVVDYVDEALEKYAFKRPANSFLPTTFKAARDVAEKIHTLADETVEITKKADLPLEKLPDVNPGSALDSSIGELRTLRQAEDELQEHLRG